MGNTDKKANEYQVMNRLLFRRWSSKRHGGRKRGDSEQVSMSFLVLQVDACEEHGTLLEDKGNVHTEK
jgi:hypothetical protein